MINARKKSHRTVEITDPDLGRAAIEVEGTFFVDLGWGIRSGKDLDANGRSAGKRGGCVSDEPAFLSLGEQDDISDSHLAIATKDSLLDCGEFAGIQVIEEIGDSASSLTMIEARRWRHNELASGVDLKTLGPIGECGISADFEPPFRGRSVDCDGHI
jgi:hypothetical protein